MKANKPKILIISSDTGGGHRSAAQALTEGVQKFWEGGSVPVRVIKAVEDSHQISDRLVQTYNWILRHRQHWMKYVYWLFNRFRPETSPYILDRCIGYLKDQFERYCPSVVVSVHPLTQHIFARIIRELKLEDQIPLVTVVTDPCYGFWRGWACDDVSLYLVANDDARRQLVDYGIANDKIKIVGMPINPKFTPIDEADARVARQAFGLEPDKFTVFVNAGYVGGGNIPKIFKELVKGELDVQAIFLAGRNDVLRKEAEQIAETANFPVKVIGYSDEIEKIMQSANIMISKLGGLTTFEALACRLPIIADATTPPMPQEAGTVSLVARNGAAVLLEKTTDIVPVLRSLTTDRVRHSEMKKAATILARPESTKRIVEEINALLPQAKVADVKTA